MWQRRVSYLRQLIEQANTLRLLLALQQCLKGIVDACLFCCPPHDEQMINLKVTGYLLQRLTIVLQTLDRHQEAKLAPCSIPPVHLL
jgi:hypothetical protein